MKAVGLIVEYNPFHNGHAYHLSKAKEVSNADVVIAVMSGNFLQRGEPALVSKWDRTRMALLNGADIVFELPYRFATQKAETFANGAVSILDAAGCDFLCFGSESGDLESFYRTINYLDSMQETFNDNLKKIISTGVSYPKALSLSFQQLADSSSYLDLSKPNNILGYQYIKAIIDQHSSIEPLTIARKNADYHDEHFASETIASATSIRKALFSAKTDLQTIDQYVPFETRTVLEDYLSIFGTFHQWENYWSLLQFRILQCHPEELKEIYEVEEGIEHRIYNAALEALSFKEFMEKIKTKRYTWTRLQRICVHILTNAKKTDMMLKQEKASYLRLLGMTASGKEYLNKMKTQFGLPVISKLSAYKGKDVNLDIKASRVYSFGVPAHLRNKLLTKEFQQPPIYIQKKDDALL